MGAYRDLTGQTFGKLTVIERADIGRNAPVKWLCRCECGGQKVCTSSALLSGGNTTCGDCRGSIRVGNKYGRLTALTKFRRNGNTYWKCVCDCGEIVDVSSGNLSRGNSLSCGCLANELTSQRSKTHGASDERIYGIWEGLKQRCYNQNVKAYKYYGGKGISVCEEWQEFLPFYEWAISHGYRDDLSIDRIDVNGNYEPSNCRWATRLEQANNTKSNTRIRYNGKSMTLAEWSRETGIGRSTLQWRHSHGWSDVECIEGKRKPKNS